ncbi:response regulator [Bacteroidetes/Chlorobi group bacterium ChocPot_Mid]|jgi:sigma-B regulation protein RsbU (phosphoserine phosphatase)|nr:MAG: response regulator [Bacteroidetes/Chlorobi group bacterium ChocPot_Mid]
MISLFDIEYPRTPVLLVFDTKQESLKETGNMLSDSGYKVFLADSPNTLYQLIQISNPDLIIVNIQNSASLGFKICQTMRNNGICTEVPVIFTASEVKTEDVLKAFNLGAVDYIARPFEPAVFFARLKSHLMLKFSREELKNTTIQLNNINRELAKIYSEKDKYLSIISKELQTASEYVISILPQPISKGSIRTSWKFVPSTKLGGDSFGYHWIDEDNWAVYLLDVCYHGIAPALLSISVLNTLRQQNLRKTDFLNPADVLNSLNKVFQMTEHNEMYFSIWYGIYNKSKRTLRYASAGHPPALLLDSEWTDSYLTSRNILIGVDEDYQFKEQTCNIPKNSRMYIFSDGVYEILKADKKRWTLEEFYRFLIKASKKNNDDGTTLEMDDAYNYAIKLRKGKKLRDDFSILKVTFL